MRFLRLLCASFLFACGSDSTSDAGADATANDAAADASPGDAGADVVVTDLECAEAGAGCQTCCSTIHPDASGVFDTIMAACSCDDGGACQTSCASSFCAGQTSNKTCDTCISNKCYPSAKTGCNADPNCKTWLACLVPCP
jgi:hypothetical protein